GLCGQSCPRGVNLSGMWRVHRLDQINAKKPAKLLDSRSLTLSFSRKQIWSVFLVSRQLDRILPNSGRRVTRPQSRSCSHSRPQRDAPSGNWTGYLATRHTGAIVSALPIMYSLRMAWSPQVPRRKVASGRGVAWPSRIGKPFGSAARPGFWAYVRRFFLRPTWKTLPFAMALVCIGAALPAPAVARFVGWLLDLHWEQVFRNPERMGDVARLDGACQALCCYLFGILPLEYL